jgi:hypothetical protein
MINAIANASRVPTNDAMIRLFPSQDKKRSPCYRICTMSTEMPQVLVFHLTDRNALKRYPFFTRSSFRIKILSMVKNRYLHKKQRSGTILPAEESKKTGISSPANHGFFRVNHYSRLPVSGSLVWKEDLFNRPLLPRPLAIYTHHWRGMAVLPPRP